MGPGVCNTQHFEDVPHVLWLNIPLKPLKTPVLGLKSPQRKNRTKGFHQKGVCGKLWCSIYRYYLIERYYSDRLLGACAAEKVIEFW